MTQFLIIDLNNLMRRAQHGKGMGGAGEDFAGLVLHTSLDTLRYFYSLFQGGHLVVCVDQSPSWRKEIYSEYKAKREYDAEDQIVGDLIRDLTEYLKEKTNATVLRTPGAEADDLIGRWCAIHSGFEYKNLIISGDNDFRQLVNSNTELYSPNTNRLITGSGTFYRDGKRDFPEDTITQRYGQDWKVLIENGKPVQIDPEYELFLKCIRGDISDNIPSAYPRIRESRLIRAWADRGGLEWNNLINATWGEDGANSVRQRYEMNRDLIDLSRIPKSITDRLDDCIGEELLKPKRSMVSVHFAKYCERHQLFRIVDQLSSYTLMLNERYPLGLADSHQHPEELKNANLSFSSFSTTPL